MTKLRKNGVFTLELRVYHAHLKLKPLKIQF